MGKRAPGAADGDAAYRKRQKLTHDVPTGEEVSSGEELRKLLAFDQDLRRARHGLQSLKMVLDDAIGADERSRQEDKLSILKQYLEAAKPKHIGDESVYLNDIMEMWSFAAQVNDDGVMSSVAVVLALILQVVSGSLELVPHGLGICQTLLQDSQLKSLSKNLSAEKGKGFIISPTLRLLREAVCLDGGAFARRIARAKAFTFTALARNMDVGLSVEAQDDTRKASVRTNAVRFFLSCLKYLQSDGRRDLLSQRELLSHLIYLIKSDPPYLVSEILDGLKSHILMDSKISRDMKFKCFPLKALIRILGLYNYTSPIGTLEEKEAVSEKAHQFLLHICTKSGAGILYPCKGLYPKETDEELSRRSNKTTSSGYSGVRGEERFSEGISVHNFVLSELAKKLRPWSTLKHNELLVAIFTAAPELIADYFINNRSFTFEPKLSMTWIGYAAFLFNTMSIPLPKFFGDAARYATTPPPTSILLDNIIPLPLNQKTLIRCLSLKSNLTSFFATRILVLALEKLDRAVNMCGEGFRSDSPIWLEAMRSLTDAFCQRIPDMKEVVRCYKSIPSENILHKTLTSRLLRLYYEVVPRVALSANFDVSPFFAGVLKSLADDAVKADVHAFSSMELENLVSIASYSPGMRWFSKMDTAGEAEALSPFTALIRLLCREDHSVPFAELKDILAQVAVENQLVLEVTELKPLLRALRASVSQVGFGEAVVIFSFLDNCISRCATAPVKYLDLMNSQATASETSSESGMVSLLTVAIVEQLPFATKAATAKSKKNLSRFLSLYFNAEHMAGQSKNLLQTYYSSVSQQLLSNSSDLKKLGDPKELKHLEKIDLGVERDKNSGEGGSHAQRALDSETLEAMLQTPIKVGDDTAVLTKWASKSVEDLIEDGWVERLVRLLASEHINIRKEALVNLLKMAAQFDESSYEEKTQVWLLLSELAESSKSFVDQSPVPSAFIAFTIHSLEILTTPLHPLYPKVNAYLARSPLWPPEKLPLAHDILHGEPSEDDKYYTEISWLLGYLVDGLQTPSDLSVFHKHRWFEKILALGSNPYLRASLRNKMLKIVYRTTCIEGGSTTLVTRFGVLSWLEAQRANCGRVKEDEMMYAALGKRIWDTCDQERVMAWSKGGAKRLVESFTMQ